MTEEKELVGITVKKEENFSEWYNQVALKADLADFTEIKGFMLIKPNAYEIWEKIQEWFNKRIKETGHRNAYAPALIPESFLKKEKEHLEGFTAEAFWVTHEGPNKLDERYALRPTSETIIYDSYSKWINSWRDLPILYNYWNSVFRYETKMTKLFLRTREFLWQEGHTVHATEKEAEEETLDMIKLYKKLAEELLAIPVIAGIKTDKEKFAGADITTTIEGLMPDGKALQMGTSHNLGQNFSKPFNLTFLDKDEKEKYAWNTSWGFSTRLIGALIMVHGDDKGLVLPPKAAPIQTVIVPILFEETKEKVLKKAKELEKKLSEKFSVKLDDRENYTAGWKFNHWELCGVPIRVEIGPKDLEKGQAVIVRRDTGKKEFVKEKDLPTRIESVLEDIQKSLFNKAENFLKKNTHEVNDYKKFKEIMNEKRGFIKTAWCGSSECEDKIQEETTATIRAVSFNSKEKGKCIFCGNKAKHSEVYFAKSY